MRYLNKNNYRINVECGYMVAATIISTIGLMTAVALSRESPQKKTIRDIIQSEMKIQKNHFTGE